MCKCARVSPVTGNGSGNLRKGCSTPPVHLPSAPSTCPLLPLFRPDSFCPAFQYLWPPCDVAIPAPARQYEVPFWAPWAARHAPFSSPCSALPLHSPMPFSAPGWWLLVFQPHPKPLNTAYHQGTALRCLPQDHPHGGSLCPTGGVGWPISASSAPLGCVWCVYVR